MANARVASRLFDAANQADHDGPAVTARIFWLKARAGWKEKDELALTGAEGKDLFPEATPVQLASLAEAAAKTLRRAAHGK
jgi:hypothetical protein